MGFDLEETINTLRSCHNDYNLAVRKKKKLLKKKSYREIFSVII
jgi:hypothetical protein